MVIITIFANNINMFVLLHSFQSRSPVFRYLKRSHSFRFAYRSDLQYFAPLTQWRIPSNRWWNTFSSHSALVRPLSRHCETSAQCAVPAGPAVEENVQLIGLLEGIHWRHFEDPLYRLCTPLMGHCSDQQSEIHPIFSIYTGNSLFDFTVQTISAMITRSCIVSIRNVFQLWVSPLVSVSHIDANACSGRLSARQIRHNMRPFLTEFEASTKSSSIWGEITITKATNHNKHTETAWRRIKKKKWMLLFE